MSRPTLQEGLNSLKEFQLRKENAVLLEKANAHTKQLELLAAETNQNRRDFDERISRLETTISNLKNAEQKDRQDFEKFTDDMAALRSQIGNVIGKVDVHGQQLAEAREATISCYQTDDTHISDALETLSRPPSAMTSLVVTRQHLPSSSKTTEVALESINAPITYNRPPSSELTTTFFNGPVTRRRSRSIDLSTSNQPPIQTVPQPSRAKAVASSSKAEKSSKLVPTAIKIPRLHQGTTSLITYLNKTTSVFQCLHNPDDQKFNTDFVTAFIKGIRDADKRKLLVEELQQQHPSRTKKDGKIEIMCLWEDVGEVMETAGLLATSDVDCGPKSQSQKFTRGLRGLLEN